MYLPTTPEKSLFCLIRCASWNEAMCRVQSRPCEAAETIKDGEHEVFPLHEACKQKPPTELIEALLSAYKPAMKMKGPGKQLPIHIACNFGASIDVIKLLIKSNQKSIQSEDSSGKLPLHIACKLGLAGDIINLLLINYPDGIKVRDSEQKNAFDYANMVDCEFGRTEILNVLDLADVYCKVAEAAVLNTSQTHDIENVVNDENNEPEENVVLKVNSTLSIRNCKQTEKDLHEEINKLNSLISKLKAESEDLRTAKIENEKAVVGIENLDSDIEREDKKSRENEALVNNRERDLRDEIENLNKLVSNMKRDNGMLEEAGHNSKMTLANLRSTLEIEENKTKTLSLELEKSKTDYSIIEEEKYEIERSRQDLQDEVKHLKALISDLESDCQELKIAEQDAIDALEDLTSDLAEEVKRSNSLSHELAAQRKEKSGHSSHTPCTDFDISMENIETVQIIQQKLGLLRKQLCREREAEAEKKQNLQKLLDQETEKMESLEEKLMKKYNAEEQMMQKNLSTQENLSCELRNSREQVMCLKEENARQRTEREDLEKTHAAKIIALEGTLKQLTELKELEDGELSDALSTQKALTSDLNTSRDQIQHLKAEKASLQDKILTLERSVEDMMEMKKTNEYEVSDALRKQKHLIEENIKLQDEVKKLKDTLNKMTLKTKSSERDLCKLERKREDLDHELNLSREQAKHMENENFKLEEEVRKYKDKLQEMTRLKEKVNFELSNALRNHELLSNDLEISREDKQRLWEEKVKIQNEVFSLREKNQNLLENDSKLNDTLHKQHASLSADLRKTRENVQCLRSENFRMKEEIQSLRKEVKIHSATSAELDEVTDTLEKLMLHCDIISKEKERLEKEIETAVVSKRKDVHRVAVARSDYSQDKRGRSMCRKPVIVENKEKKHVGGKDSFSSHGKILKSSSNTSIYKNNNMKYTRSASSRGRIEKSEHGENKMHGSSSKNNEEFMKYKSKLSRPQKIKKSTNISEDNRNKVQMTPSTASEEDFNTDTRIAKLAIGKSSSNTSEDSSQIHEISSSTIQEDERESKSCSRSVSLLERKGRNSSVDERHKRMLERHVKLKKSRNSPSSLSKDGSQSESSRSSKGISSRTSSEGDNTYDRRYGRYIKTTTSSTILEDNKCGTTYNRNMEKINTNEEMNQNISLEEYNVIDECAKSENNSVQLESKPQSPVNTSLLEEKSNRSNGKQENDSINLKSPRGSTQTTSSTVIKKKSDESEQQSLATTYSSSEENSDRILKQENDAMNSKFSRGNNQTPLSSMIKKESNNNLGIGSNVRPRTSDQQRNENSLGAPATLCSPRSACTYSNLSVDEERSESSTQRRADGRGSTLRDKLRSIQRS